jgi:transposase
VARLLGVHRNTVGRWLAVYAAGGVAQRLTIAQAPGTAPLLSEAMRQALRHRVAQPEGLASDKTLWQWLQQEYGRALADQTVHTFVRDTLGAQVKGPRNSPLKKR